MDLFKGLYWVACGAMPNFLFTTTLLIWRLANLISSPCGFGDKWLDVAQEKCLASID